MRIDLALNQIHAIKLMLADAGDEEDERLLIDTIEGETDAFALVGKLLNGIEREEGDRTALTEQMEVRKARRDRCDKRIAVQRDAIMAVMDCAGLDKLPLPEATLTKRMTAAKLVVNDPAAVPQDYAVATWKPNMEAIKAAFTPGDPQNPNWLRTDDARPSLTIRRK